MNPLVRDPLVLTIADITTRRNEAVALFRVLEEAASSFGDASRRLQAIQNEDNLEELTDILTSDFFIKLDQVQAKGNALDLPIPLSVILGWNNENHPLRSLLTSDEVQPYTYEGVDAGYDPRLCTMTEIEKLRRLESVASERQAAAQLLSQQLQEYLSKSSSH